MTGAFGGAEVLNNRPRKYLVEIYPGQDLEVFWRVPAGERTWPGGTTAELRFLDGPDPKTATVLHTATIDVDPTFLHVHVESADLEALPIKAWLALYAALPTNPNTNYLCGSGTTAYKKLT